MAELDNSLIDFFRVRTIERRIERGPDAEAEAAAEYARWWWTNKKRYLPCSQGTVWVNGEPIFCELPVHHEPPCIGAGLDGHERAFSIR